MDGDKQIKQQEGTSSLIVRVRYQETDQMGVAWHGNYVGWFEIARTEWWRSQGESYRELEEKGYYLPVLRMGCDYKESARFDDVLEVFPSLQSYNGARLTFSYRIERTSDRKVIAAGFTEHAFVDRSFHIVRIDRHLPQIHQVLIRS